MSTADLAAGVTGLAGQRLPDDVVQASVNSILNVVGTSIGASDRDAVDIVLRTAHEHGADGVSPVPGRTERVDLLSAALATGLAAHLDDFDDTHLATVVHPAAASFAAGLGLVASRESSGLRFVESVAIGIEAQLRVAVAMTPWHYDQGWHITGTVGSIGAAVTAGVLTDLDENQMLHAIAIASSLSLGHRESFGTMVKPFHPGKAAGNGLLAASLAKRGFTGATDALEGARGYFSVLSPDVDLSGLTDEWGTRWELFDNTFKPYPCGIVSHPAIEAAEGLHGRLEGASPAAVRVRCHPLVVELTGNPDPHTGLAAKFSTIHGVAAGLINGSVGIDQYEDEWVTSEDATAMRAITTLVADDEVARDEATVEVDLGDGRTIEQRVEHARGSLARPMSDDELDAKVNALVERTMPGRAPVVIAATRDLPKADSCHAFLAEISPEAT